MDFIEQETNTNYSDFFQNMQYNGFVNSFDEECFDQKFSNDFLSEDLLNDFETEFNGSLTSSLNGNLQNNLKGNIQNLHPLYEEEEEDIGLEQSQLIQARLENFQLKQSLEELQDEIQLTKFELEKESVLMKQTKKKFHNAKTMYNNLIKQQQLRNYQLQTEPQQKKKSNVYKKKQNDPTHARNNKRKHTKKRNYKKQCQQKNKNESTVLKHKRKTQEPQQKFLDKSNFNLFVSQLKNLQQATVGEN